MMLDGRDAMELPRYCLDYITTRSPSALNGRRVVVGYSGSFGIEQAIAAGRCQLVGVFSNDVNLYSCALGWWLTGQQVDIQINDNAPDWARRAWGKGAKGIACIDVLLEALAFEKRANAHQCRMWEAYARHFSSMVEERCRCLEKWPKVLTDFYAGDVFEHFRQHDDEMSVFIYFSATYAGGYERMYKRLEAMFNWPKPQYAILDKTRKNALLRWMAARHFLWFDDRMLEDMKPSMIFRRDSTRSIYLYGNAFDEPGYIEPSRPCQSPKLTLANDTLRLSATTTITLLEISTSELATYKDMFLNKHIDHKPGMWAIAVLADNVAIGFFEFATRQEYGGKDEVYLNSDFSVSGTRYRRLSKLISMLATCGDTRRFLERKRELPQRKVFTTAFTDKPVSMKYRGVFRLVKRGEKNGQKYLNYMTEFRNDTVQEVYEEWMKNNLTDL